MARDKPKRKPSQHNTLLGKLLKSAAIKGESQAIIKETFSRAHALAGRVQRGELTLKAATVELLAAIPGRVLTGAARILPTVLAGGSHAPIQHGRSRGPTTDTRKGRRRNRPV